MKEEINELGDLDVVDGDCGFVALGNCLQCWSSFTPQTETPWMRQACQVRALKISAYQYRSFKISPAEIGPA